MPTKAKESPEAEVAEPQPELSERDKLLQEQANLVAWIQDLEGRLSNKANVESRLAYINGWLARDNGQVVEA